MSEKDTPSANLTLENYLSVKRQGILDMFADHPENPEIWDVAYAWVRAEGDDCDRNGIASDIPGEELITKADEVRATDPSKRYNLMTGHTSTGRLWFDVIEGFSMKPVRDALAKVIKSGVHHNQAPFYRVLDVGTGIGNSLEVLEQHADNVVAVDRNQALLEVAKQRAGSRTTLVRADITRLPFESNSFDLLASLGVEGSLDRESRTAFYRELARIMMPGATYVAAFYNYPYMPAAEMDKITQTSKGMLADMICDTVSGGASIIDRLDSDAEDTLLAELELQKQYHLEVNEDETEHVVIQALIKDRTE